MARFNLNGITRAVLLIGPYAIKFPRVDYGWRMFLRGLLANMQEMEWSRAPIDGICPVLCGLPGGFAIVMQRARPMTDAEFANFDVEAFCTRDSYSIPAERKSDSFGWLKGAPVALDYGN